jgi:hypothetical protein
MTELPMAHPKAKLALIVLLAICLSWPLIIPAGAGAQSRGIGLEAAAAPGITPAGGTYRALIIGNDAYSDGSGLWKPLKTAVAGARALGSLLTERYGFADVELLENATRREILIALQDLARRVMANDSVIMYYAGHGFINLETEKGYWVPVDAKDTDHTTFLRNSTIRDELSTIASRAKHTLLISDSCFSGTLLRSGTRGISTQGATEAYYRKVANKKSIQILTAGGVEYVDDDYQRSGHSPFTYFLLNELTHNERPLLTASELSTHVEKAVANNVDQVPESGVFQGAGDELGEFIFINIDVVVDGLSKEKVKVKVNVVDAGPGTDTGVVDTQPSQATASDLSLGLGVELLAGGWSGSDAAGDTDFDGGGGQLGLDISLQKRRFYTILGLESGTYTFSGDAPGQVSATETTASSDVKITHTELDLALGYYFWKHVSLFLNLQAVTNKWDNNDYELQYGGFGGGVTGNWPIAKRWDIFGSLSILPKTSVNGDDKKVGDVSGGEIELGAAYGASDRHRFGLGLRVASQNYDFDAGDDQEHQMAGVFFRYDYRYGF